MKNFKVLALFLAVSMMAAMFMAMPALAKQADVNVAEGKYVVSSQYGGGSWDGSEWSAERLVDGSGSGVYVSAIPHYASDIITIDLFDDYTVTGVVIDTYGNDDPSDDFYMADSTFVVKAKKTPNDAGVTLTRRMNGTSGYFPQNGGGYKSYFDISGSEKYRYIEVNYTEGGEGAKDATIPEIRVFAPAEEATNEEAKRVAPVSFGKSVTAGKSPTWGSYAGITDRNISTNYYAYNTVDGAAWVTIDLGVAYPIKMVVPYMQVGGVSDVLASNTADFKEAIYLEKDNVHGYFVPEETDAGDNYRYIKLINTVAESSATDLNLSTAYKEVIVYSTPEAAETNVLTDISSTATMSSSLKDGAYNPWPVNQAVDGNEETTAGIYNANESSYIQADLGHTQDIKSINIINANKWGWVGTGKVKYVQLSNDPAFGTYEQMICTERIAGENNSDYVDYKSDWMYAGNQAYRYVRIYGTPAAAKYTNWGSDETLSFTIKEMKIFATEKSAALNNVVLNKEPTLTNGEWMFTTAGANLVDGNKGTVAYAANALAVFELDYPMDIERVEIDFRGDGEPTDNDRHYEIYLSDTASKDGAVQLLSTNESYSQINYNTVVVSNDSDEKYKYVLVGSTSNFWGLTEVRVMSSDTISAAEYTREFSDDAFEAGETQTYTLSFRSPNAVEKTVRPIIARYDGGKLTDIKIGDVTNISGKSGKVTLSYTLDNNQTVDATTKLRAYVWETDASGKTNLKPFCKSKTK